jgi:sulfur transfer protein SufE
MKCVCEKREHVNGIYRKVVKVASSSRRLKLSFRADWDASMMRGLLVLAAYLAPDLQIRYLPRLGDLLFVNIVNW